MNAAQVTANDQSVQAPALMTPDMVLAVVRHLIEADALDPSAIEYHGEGHDIAAGYLAEQALERGHPFALVLDMFHAAAIGMGRPTDGIGLKITIATVEAAIEFIKSPEFAAHTETDREEVLNHLNRLGEAYSGTPGAKVWLAVGDAYFFVHSEQLMNPNDHGEAVSDGIARNARLIAGSLHDLDRSLADEFVAELRSMAEMCPHAA